MSSTIRTPKIFEVIIVLLLFFMIMILSTAVYDIPLQLAMLVVWFLFIGYGLYLGYTYNHLQKAIADGIHSGIEATLVLTVVGGVIGTWIAGGIVPTMIYYGLQIIHPNIFLLATLFICAITSLTIGTAWGTVGTAGLAMMAVGESFGMPAGIIAGAIISGATFGDKLSPLSDTTVMTASLGKIDVMEHVRSMLWVSLPAFVISGILFTVAGIFYVDKKSIDLTIVQGNMQVLDDYFNIAWYMLIPMVVVLILLMMKKPAIPTLSLGILMGVVWAWLFQGMDFIAAFTTAYTGLGEEVGIKFLDGIIGAGGIYSMFDVILFVILALGFGGLLQELKILQYVTDLLDKWIKRSTGRLTISTLLASFAGNLFGGANYVALITGVKSTEGNHERLGVKKSVMTRNTEIGGTLTGSMIPWTENGMFYPAILGVATLSYLPFMWVAFLSIIITIIYGYTGKGIWYEEGRQANAANDIEK